MVKKSTDPSQDTTAEETSAASAPNINQSKSSPFVDLDIFGLKNLWPHLPWKKVSGNHIAFFVCTAFFVTFAFFVFFEHPPVPEWMPFFVVLSITLGLSSWRAFF